MIIALGHRKRAGKDKFSMFLAEALRGIRGNGIMKLPIQIMPLAYSLKQAVATMYPGVIGNYSEYEEGNPHCRDKDAVIPLIDKSARQVWLDVGRALAVIDPQMMPRACCLRMPQKHGRLADGFYIVPDTRRLTECEYFPTVSDTLFVRVDRYEAGELMAPIDPAGHRLDEELAGWQGWRVIVRNDGSLGDLHDKAKLLADYIKGIGVPPLETSGPSFVI